MGHLKMKTINEGNINFHLVPTEKFKTITFVAKLKAPLARETVTKRALLPYVLKQGTDKYPSEKELQMKLDELYGALLHVTTTKKGNYNIIHFQLEIANEKFVDQADQITNDALQLFHHVIFSPLIEDGKFNEQIVAREKKQLENKINSVYDNKIAYANERLIDEMFAEEPFSLHTDGYVEDLQSLDSENLAKYYHEMITNDDFDLYILGDFVVNEMEEQVTSLFTRDAATKNLEAQAENIQPQSVEAKKLVESDTIHQAKLHIGYRTNILYKDETYSALQVFNGLFGAFPNSKLFLNVREKHSLAYYIASRVESHAGLLLVYSGVENTEYDRTYSIIEEQLEELRKGNFTDADLKSVQDLIISNIKETLDHPAGTIELLYQQVVGKKELPLENIIDEINSVTKNEVIEVAKQINLDTIYVLAGEVGE